MPSEPHHRMNHEAIDRAAHGADPHADHEHQDGHGDEHAAHPVTDAPQAHAGHDVDAGHDAHAGHSVAMFRDRFWLSAILTLPILVWSEMIQDWLGFTAPDFPGSALIPPVLGTAVFLYGGSPFLRGGVREIQDRQPGMMLLISLAITVAFVASLASTLGWFDLEFWWELALLIDVMLLGHWQEMKALGQASSALDALAALLPDVAERLGSDGSVAEVAVADLAVGDAVLVRPGARVPADGTVQTGEAAFDESMITGESRAVPRRPGDRVVAGTVATDSSVRVRVDAVGEQTALAGIRRLVAEAQASRSRTQALADRAAKWLFFIALGAGALTMATWTLLGRPDQGVERTVTVLVIACPHALGLAIPLVVAISTSMSARAGILVKDRLSLERMRTVDTVLFDKTGTLTKGQPAVTDAVALDGDTDRLLAVAAAAESESEHPVARAIGRAAPSERPAARNVRALPGRGVEATVDGRHVVVGGPAALREAGLDLPAEVSDATAPWRERGAAVISVVADGAVVGAIAVEDEIRPESFDAVRGLHEVGVRVAMITGDARQVADAVGLELGIDEIHAEVLPEQKEAVVAALRQGGTRVAMVGDGVNDAPALARADVGVAIGAGTDVAIGSAGVVLASDDPRGVLAVRRLSSASYRKMVQNLGWATGYNLVAIPLAAGVLARAGIVLPPALGALFMSLSTIVVALNAQLLRRIDLRA
jgi:P-type Cu2+ transporter